MKKNLKLLGTGTLILTLIAPHAFAGRNGGSRGGGGGGGSSSRGSSYGSSSSSSSSRSTPSYSNSSSGSSYRNSPSSSSSSSGNSYRTTPAYGSSSPSSSRSSPSYSSGSSGGSTYRSTPAYGSSSRSSYDTDTSTSSRRTSPPPMFRAATPTQSQSKVSSTTTQARSKIYEAATSGQLGSRLSQIRSNSRSASAQKVNAVWSKQSTQTYSRLATTSAAVGVSQDQLSRVKRLTDRNPYFARTMRNNSRVIEVAAARPQSFLPGLVKSYILYSLLGERFSIFFMPTHHWLLFTLFLPHKQQQAVNQYITYISNDSNYDGSQEYFEEGFADWSANYPSDSGLNANETNALAANMKCFSQDATAEESFACTTLSDTEKTEAVQLAKTIDEEGEKEDAEADENISKFMEEQEAKEAAEAAAVAAAEEAKRQKYFEEERIRIAKEEEKQRIEQEKQRVLEEKARLEREAQRVKERIHELTTEIQTHTALAHNLKWIDESMISVIQQNCQSPWYEVDNYFIRDCFLEKMHDIQAQTLAAYKTLYLKGVEDMCRELVTLDKTSKCEKQTNSISKAVTLPMVETSMLKAMREKYPRRWLPGKTIMQTLFE